MKSNKFSLNAFMNRTKVDFVSHSKYYLATLGLILLSAIIMISVIGIRLNFDFTGGTIAELVYNVDADGTTYSEKDIAEGAKEIFSDAGIEIYSLQKEQGSFGDKIIFKLDSNGLSDSKLADLKTSLYEKFDSYDEEHIIQSRYIDLYNVEGVAGSMAVYASTGLAVAIVLFAIGVLIRYGLSQALVALIVSVVNILLTFAFVIICRISVGAAFIGSIFTVFILTTISTLIFFDRVRENINKTENKDVTKYQHSNQAIKGCLSTLFLIFLISLISFLLVSGLGVAPIRGFGIPVVFGAVISLLSTIYLVPFFWTIINIKIRRKK